MSINKEDLLHMENNLKEHINLKMLALPCADHGRQLDSLQPRVRNLETWRTKIVVVSSTAWTMVVTYLGLKHGKS